MPELTLESVGLLTLADAAARRGVHERTLRRWVEAGLPAVLVGGSSRAAYYLFRPQDVDSWSPRGRGRPAGSKNREKSESKNPTKTRRKQRFRRK